MEKLETFGMLTLNLRNTTMGEKTNLSCPSPIYAWMACSVQQQQGDIPPEQKS